MKYVYIFSSRVTTDRHDIGITSNLRDRLKKHNAGKVSRTAKFVPRDINTYVAFSDEDRAFAFEKYLKSGSGRAFAKRHL